MERLMGDNEKESHEGWPSKACNNWYYVPGIPENIDIVNFAMSYADKTGNASPQIHEGMDLDSPFVFAKMGPGKQGENIFPSSPGSLIGL
jgi:hypothetical protein